VESKWKNYHITTFPGQSLSKNRETQFGRAYGPVARQSNTLTVVYARSLVEQETKLREILARLKKN
jgi:hypothetical protein